MTRHVLHLNDCTNADFDDAVPSRFQGAIGAQHNLNLLAQQTPIESAVPIMDLMVLKERFKHSDIFPEVKVDLVREQDRKNAERVKLAQNVAHTMAMTLPKIYRGKKQQSRLVLRVNIAVASNGRASSKIGRLLVSGGGRAKLTVSYCLYCRESGKVAVAKQMFQSQETDKDESSETTFLALQEEVLSEITREVSLACCSRLSLWEQAARQLIRVETDEETECSSEGSM